MTVPTQENQATEIKQNDKELNFRMLEAKYQKQLAEERSARVEAERIAQEALAKRNVSVEEEDDDSEPYVDKKKLQKTLNKFGEQTKQQTQNEIKYAVQSALRDERQQNWIKANPDFYKVLEHANKFAELNPDLAEDIIQMPEGFERQKLVYRNIKALGLHQDAPKVPSIQEKIDANRKGPYYQPSGMGTAPYASAGDFSTSGQKNAYDKMQELKSRLRL